MDRKKLLIILVSTFALLGVFGASIPFFYSMKPPITAGQTLPHIDISELEPGEYLIHRDLSAGFLEFAYLILHDHGSAIRVFEIPLINDQVMLPDVHWFRWGALCTEFGPDMEEGLMRENGVIQCQDDEPPEWGDEWRWAYDGKNLGQYTDDMEVPRYQLEGPYVVIGKR